jgi:hypothetical protein
MTDTEHKTSSFVSQLEAARRELHEAEKRLDHHTITEHEIIRRNRAERIVREMEDKQRRRP